MTREDLDRNLNQRASSAKKKNKEEEEKQQALQGLRQQILGNSDADEKKQALQGLREQLVGPETVQRHTSQAAANRLSTNYPAAPKTPLQTLPALPDQKSNTRNFSLIDASARSKEESKLQQFNADLANAIDQGSAQYVGDQYRRQQNIRNRLSGNLDDFQNRRVNTQSYSNDYMEQAINQLKDRLYTGYTAQEILPESERLSREERDAVLNRYNTARDSLYDTQGSWSQRSADYIDAAYETSKYGGVGQLLAEQNADAENDREYRRQLHGFDVSGMGKLERGWEALSHTVSAGAKKTAESGVGIAASVLNRGALNATETYGPALEAAAKQLYYGLYNNPDMDFRTQADMVRKAANYIGGDGYADQVIQKIYEKAKLDRESGNVISGNILDGIDVDENVLWGNVQDVVRGTGVYDAMKKLSQSASQDIQYAKDVTPIESKFGDDLVEAGVSVVQNVGDATLAAMLHLTGGAAYIPFALRAFGGAYSDGLQMAGDLGELVGKDSAKKAQAYGVLQSAKEVGTEMLWGISGAISAVTGGGALDDFMLSKLTEAISGFAGTEGGAKFLTWLGTKLLGGATEGIEEVVGDAVEYIFNLSGIMTGESRPDIDEALTDAIHSFITGALGGILGDTTQVVAKPLQQAETGRQLKKGNITTESGIKVSVDDIMKIADLPGMQGTELWDAVNDITGAYSGRNRSVESLSNKDLGRLYEAYVNTLGNSDAAINRIVTSLDKIASGERLSNGDVNRITQNADAVKYLQSIDSTLAFDGDITERRAAVETALKALASENKALSAAKLINSLATENNANLGELQAALQTAADRRYEMPSKIAGSYYMNRQTNDLKTSLQKRGLSQEAQDTISRFYNGDANVEEFASQASNAWNLGRSNQSGNELSNEFKPIYESARLSYLEEMARYGREKVQLRGSSERNAGQDSVGQTGTVVESAGGNQAGQARYQQGEGTAQRLYTGDRVGNEVSKSNLSAESLAAAGYNIVTDTENDQDAKEVQAIADKFGLDVVMWRGAMLNTGDKRQDGSPVGERGFCVERDNKPILIGVQLDNLTYTAKDTAEHEAGHALKILGLDLGSVAESDDKISKQTALGRMIKKLGGGRKGRAKLMAAVNAYAEAYAGSGILQEKEGGGFTNADLDYVFEEMFCDAGPGMNAFREKGLEAEAKKHAPVMEAAKTVREELEKNFIRGPTASELNNSTTARSVKESIESPVKTSIDIAGSIASNAHAAAERKHGDVAAVDKAHRDIQNILIPLVKPLIGKTDKNGMPLIPDETQYSNNIFSNGSYGFDAEPTTECYRQMGYRELAKKVTDILGRPLTNIEAIIVNQAAVEIAIDPPCLYCYSLLDRKAKEAYKIQYLNERDAFEKMFERDYGKDKKALLKDIDKQLDASNPESYYAIYLNNGKGTRTDNKDKKARIKLWMEMWANGIKGVSMLDVRNMDAEEATRKHLDTLENKTVRDYKKQSLNDVQKWVQAASQAKKYIPYSAYTNGGKGSLLSWKQNRIDLLNSEYGLRWYSHADFHPAFAIDNMQQVIDASIMGLKGLMYCKPIAAAKIMAPTGMNINVSCFAQFKDGKYISDDKLGANWDEVKALRDQYNNVGSVMVVTSDDALIWALAQDWIDVVIPLHRVRSGSEFIQEFGLSDYTGQQADKLEGQAAKDKFEEFLAAYAKENNLTDKQAATAGKKMKSVYPAEHQNDYDTYTKICEERGLTPRFEKIRQEILTGNYSYDGVQLTPAMYMKLVNETRQSESQTQVLKPTFDMDAAEDAVKTLKDQGYFEYFKDASEWNGKQMTLDDWAQQAADDIKAGKKPTELGYGRDLAVNANGQYIVSKKQAKAEGQHGIHYSSALSNNYNELYEDLSDGRIRMRNVEDMSTEDWKLIYKAVNKLGYGLKSWQDAKEVYSRYGGKNGFNKEQSDAIKKAYGVAEGAGVVANPKREALARKLFGTTGDFREAGYLMRNGSMLDFSGKKDGGPGQVRYMDHREISGAFADGEIPAEKTRYGDISAYMNAFIGEGNIRLMDGQGVTIGEMEPTSQQYSVLRQFINRVLKNEDYFYLDLSNDDGYTVASRDYTASDGADRIIRDIKEYYKNGELPYKSDLSQFIGQPRFSSVLDVRALNVDWMDGKTIKDQLIKHRDEIISMPPVVKIDYAGEIDRDLRERIMDQLQNVGGGAMKWGNIEYSFDETGAANLVTHANDTELRAATIAAPYVAKYGKMIAGHYNHDGEGNATLTFAAPVIINDVPVHAAVVIQFTSDGRPHAVNVYAESLDDFMKLKKATSGTRKRTDKSSASILLTSDDLDKLKISRRESYVNSSVKKSVSLSNTDLVEQNRQLRKDLSELRQQLKQKTESRNYWRGQTKVTEGRRLRSDDVKKLARDILKSQDSTANVDSVAAKLKSLGEYMLNSKADMDELYDEARTKAYGIANEVLRQAKVLKETGGADFYDDFKETLRNNKMYVAPSVRGEVAPDGWGEFWNRTKSMLNLTADKTKGTTIDKVYRDLRARFGDWLLPDLANEADQLKQLMEVMDTYRPVYENLSGIEMAEAVEYTANEILTRIIGDEIRETNPTYADRMEKKLTDQKEKAQAALKRVRAQRDRTVANLELHYRKMAEERKTRKIDSENRTKLLKIARRLSNKKLPRVQRALLDQYIGDLDLVAKGILGGTVRDLEDLKARYEQWVDLYKDEMGEMFVEDEGIKKKVARLSKKHINDMTAEEVADLTTVLLSIEHDIDTQNKLLDSQVRKDTYAAALEFVQDYMNGKARDDKGLNKLLTTWTLTPERMVRRLAGYNDDDSFYKLTQELSEGQRKMLAYKMNADAQFMEWLNDKEFIKSIAGKNADVITVKGIVNGALQDVKLTRAMRMSLYLHAKNEQNLKHIEGGGVYIPNIDMYKKGKMEDAYKEGNGTHAIFSRYMIKDIVSQMTAKEKAFADAASRYFNTTSRDAINEVSEVHKGWAIAGVENYFPIHTNRDFLSADFGAMMEDGSVPGMGFLNERQPVSTKPILLRDMNTVLTQAINQHSKYYGLAIPVQNINKLLNVNLLNYDGTVKSHLMSGHLDYINKFMKDVQNGIKTSDDGGQRLLAKMRSNYAGGVLGLNPGVSGKQFASYPTAAAVLGYGPLLKALASTNRNVDLELIKKYTPLLWYRSLGFSTAEMGDIGSMKKDLPKALNWIQAVDVFTTTKLWTAAEYYVKANSKNLQTGTDAFYKEVAKIYNRVIEETQPNYTMMQRPQVLRSESDLVRSLNLFKTQPFQNFNILYDAMGNLRAKAEQYKAKGTQESLDALKDAKKTAARAITSQVMSAFLFSVIQALWDAVRGKLKKYKDEDDELTIGSAAKGIGLNMLTSFGGMAPYMGMVLEFAQSLTDTVSKALGGDAVFDQKFYGFSENSISAVNDLANDVSSLINTTIKAIKGDISAETAARSITDNLAETIQIGTGIPASNVTKDLQTIALNIARGIGLKDGGEYIMRYNALRVTTDPSKYKSDYYALLKSAWKNDTKSFEEIKKRMINMKGDPFATSTKTAEENIDAKIREWKKEDLDHNQFYQSTYSSMTSSYLWQQASAEQKESATDSLTQLALQMAGSGNSTGENLQKKVDAGKSVGLDSTSYLLYKLALQMVDQPNGEKGHGSYDKEEKAEAFGMATGRPSSQNPWK